MTGASTRASAEHIQGLPVSYTTYANHKCRCDGCRSDATRKQREFRSRSGSKTADHVKANSKAMNAAVKYVRARYPRVWRRFYEEALAEVRGDR